MNTKPFHESIISIIRAVKTPEELKLIEKLLLQTKVPKDHEAILKAYRNKAKKLEMSDKKVAAKFSEEE